MLDGLCWTTMTTSRQRDSEQLRDERYNLAWFCISSMFHAVLFLHLSHPYDPWQLPASHLAGGTKKRVDQAPRTRGARSTLPDYDDDFESVGRNVGRKVDYILLLSTNL